MASAAPSNGPEPVRPAHLTPGIAVGIDSVNLPSQGGACSRASINNLTTTLLTSSVDEPRPKSEVSSTSEGANTSYASSTAAPLPATFLARRTHDILLLIGICIMLAWPWAFWGTLRALNGVKMRNSLAKVVGKHPQSSAFFVSLVGNFVSLVVDIFFSLAVIRFAQEWVSERAKVSLFHVSLLGAFRHQSFPWTMNDLKTLMEKNRWLPVSLVGVCILSFQFVPSGTTSLLLPVPFNRTEMLLAYELDFSSTAPDCIDWLDGHPFSNSCDWQVHNNVSYTSCLGQNQLFDVLAAGRSSLLSLIPSNAESLSLTQLGAKDGMHLLGPLRGILPLGPNGAPAFDTLEKSAFSDPDIQEAMLSYNYTLEYQGLSSNISCNFDTTSPVDYSVPEGSGEVPYTLVINGVCPPGMDFLAEANVSDVLVPNSANGFGYWACKAPLAERGLPAYSLHLRGQRETGYEEMFGNITCLISPARFATFPVTYQSERRLFKSENSTSTAESAYAGLIEAALIGLTAIFKEAQSSEANLVAEAVITTGVKSFGYPARGRDERYLPLVGKMIEGMLDYEATYSRLIYSTVQDPPPSCSRDVRGKVTYSVIGWAGKLEHIGYLMPMTFLNLAALGIILVAIIITKPGPLHPLDPTHPFALVEAQHVAGEISETGRPVWTRGVSFTRSAAIQLATNRFSQDVEVMPSDNVVEEVLSAPQ